MGGGRILVGRVGTFPFRSRRISRTRRKGPLTITAMTAGSPPHVAPAGLADHSPRMRLATANKRRDRALIEDVEPLLGEQPHGHLSAVGLGGSGPRQGDWPLSRARCG